MHSRFINISLITEGGCPMANTNEPTQSEKWFNENCVDNKKELIDIGDIAMKLLHENISLDSKNPETTIAIYGTVMKAIWDQIAKLEDEYSEFCLNIANRLKLGYTNTDNEDEEKVGNFSPFMQDCDEPTSDAPIDDDEIDTIQLSVQWNAANIKTQSDIIKDCASLAKKELSETLNIKTESHEFIMPMFCIIHKAIVNFVKDPLINQENITENQINVAGLYDIGAKKVDGEIFVWYQTGVPIRRWIKNDSIATGKLEEE